MQRTMFLTRQKRMGFGGQIEGLALNRSVSVGRIVEDTDRESGRQVRFAGGKLWKCFLISFVQ